MSFELTLDEATELVEEATAPDEFDALEFVRGANTPGIPVAIYTDADAALKIANLVAKQKELEKKAKKVADNFSIVDDDDYTYEIEELQENLKATSLTLNIKGLAPKALDALTKSFEAKNGDLKTEDESAYNKAFNNLLVSKSVKGVTGPDGQYRPVAWTVQYVTDFLTELYISEQSKVYVTTANANYVAAVFDAAVSADFS